MLSLIIEGNQRQADKYERELENMYDFTKASELNDIVDNMVWLKGDILSLIVDLSTESIGNIIGDWSQKTADFLGYEDASDLKRGFKARQIGAAEKSINYLMPTFLAKMHDSLMKNFI